MNDAGRSSTIMHLLVKRYIPIRVEHIGIRILGEDMVCMIHMFVNYAHMICTIYSYDIVLHLCHIVWTTKVDE